MENSSAILIGEVVKKDVVYSADCFNQKPLDSNTQLVVEYSIMALEAQLIMASGDWHDTSRSLDGTIDVITGCMKIGSFIFPPAAPILMGIATVGAYVKKFMKLFPDNRPDPVVVKYKELETAINQLEKQMKVHFASLQSFLTDHNFDVNITTQASTLMRYMRNCLKYQDEFDVEYFKDEYEKNPPLKMAYFMASLLENRSTNPLIMAMDAEKAKTKATFNKWKTIITGILGQFLFIEAFATGLLERSDFDRDKIVKQRQDLDKSLDEWENEYKKDIGYWVELKEDFDQYFESHTHLTNAQKSQEIRERLAKYLTRDSFYIVVMNEATYEKFYGYYCNNESDQMIGAWWKGKCNAFVYRTRNNDTRRKDYAIAGKDSQDAASLLRWNGSLKNVLRDQLSMKPQFSPYGFLGLLGMHCNAQINWVNDNGPQPGHVQKMFLMDQKGNRQAEYWLITAFLTT